ncbi:MAG: 2-C-methyl-D-erythritol 4-phosphate cytidylyltransferase [Bacteroidia bacterium]|nr:2-C-methyl-D-erythritol 4-phosphate cytidylyltransferase [Bacteroidia bacterium]
MYSQQAVVIVAGGTGERSGQNIPKQFVHVLNKPVIVFSIEKFLEYDSNIELVVVCHENFVENCRQIFQVYFPNKNIPIIKGGITRFHSVKNGLEFLQQKKFSGIVAVHDAARPCVSVSLIKACFEFAQSNENAIPSISITESIRQVENGISKRVDRNQFKIIQTPQCADFSIIYNAFKQNYQDVFTDEANVLESFGETIHLIEGERNNIKITYPIDFILAEYILSQKF